MILGTRGSRLAIRQAEWVRDKLLASRPDLAIKLEVIRTSGDEQRHSPPDIPFGLPGSASLKGIFVKEIEEALLERRIDAAVHSMKDLPVQLPAGLTVAAIPLREDPRDALLTADGADLDGLRPGARLGTSSPRRSAQLRAARPDLAIEPVRGNVETRVRKMTERKLDGLVLAAAGLSRLGLLGKTGALGGMVRLLPVEVCLPAVGQGALGIETRQDDAAVQNLVELIHDARADAEVGAERSFLAALGGGCRVPVAALARVTDGRMHLQGLVASPLGTRVVRVQGEGSAGSGEELGLRLAQEAMAAGAAALLQETGG